ncbi:MAG: hypothetical protein IPH55_13055 [Betaproteobacteria bacterium]|nr:hypothetical protein [Betaproteobacteria bacterium]
MAAFDQFKQSSQVVNLADASMRAAAANATKVAATAKGRADLSHSFDQAR